MKKIFFFAAAAAMMAACSENDQLALNQQVQDQQDKGIQFGVYTNRAVTRAGQAESLNTDALKEGDGIGVFAYHTNNSKYDERTSLPNFMYNQNVVWKTVGEKGVWTYDPVKYWPNEFGENAVSEDVDYVTFFAYAPYVSVNPTTGIPEVDMKAFDAEKFAQYLGYVATDDKTAVEDFRTKEGYKAKEEGETADDAVEALKMLYIKQQQGKNITSISRNADKGDPIVRYVVDTNPQTSVDLLWGVAAENNGFVGLADKAATVSTDNCYLNLSKQIGTADSIRWKFYHALAKLNVQIIAAADVVTEGVDPYNPAADTKALQEATKIYLRSIDFTGFATRGALNLHSEDAVPGYVKPNWMNYDGTDLTAGNVTFYDGLKDGKEGYTDNINTNEKPLGLNPELIEEPTTTTWAAKRQGIPTQKYANLFAGAIDDPATTDKDEAATASIFVIPTNERMAITVIYDIMTRDTLLSQNLSDGFTKGSRVQNKISQTLEGLKLQAGKSYTIKLVVGIESVKVTVDVKDFIDPVVQKVDLPYNPKGEENATGDDTGLTPGEAAEAALDYDYDPAYTYNYEDYDIDEDVIEFTYTQQKAAQTVTVEEHERSVIVNDLARFLGGLYRNNLDDEDAHIVTELTYGGNTYTWDTEGTLIGSNWKRGDNITLVKDLAESMTLEDLQAAILSGTPIEVTIGTNLGDLTLRLVIE